MEKKTLKCPCCDYETTPGSDLIISSLLNAHVAGVHNASSSQSPSESGAPQIASTSPSAPSEERYLEQLPPSYASVFRSEEAQHVNQHQCSNHGMLNAGLELQEKGEPSHSNHSAHEIGTQDNVVENGREVHNHRRWDVQELQDLQDRRNVAPTSSVVNRPILRSFIMLISFIAGTVCIVIGALGLNDCGSDSKFVPAYSLVLGISILLQLILVLLRWYVSLSFLSMYAAFWYAIGGIFANGNFMNWHGECDQGVKKHTLYITCILIPFFIIYFLWWGKRTQADPNAFFCDPEAGSKGESDPLQVKSFYED